MKQANGVETNGAVNGDVKENGETHWKPLGARRRLRVACMGAGFSGVYMTILAEKVLQDIDLVVYEKNSDLGGTWFENRYPGVHATSPLTIIPTHSNRIPSSSASKSTYFHTFHPSFSLLYGVMVVIPSRWRPGNI